MSDGETSAEPSFLQPLRRRGERLPRWLMVVGVIAAGGVLTCCIGWVVLAVLFQPTETVVAAEVKTIAMRVAPLRAPPQFEPAWGLEADHSLALIQIARFDQTAGRGLLLVGELHVRLMAYPDERDQLVQLCETSASKLRLITPKQTQNRKLTIRGRESQFEIIDGEDRASTTKLRQVTGTFQGREGTAILILQGETEYLSNAAIDDLLSSLTEADVSK